MCHFTVLALSFLCLQQTVFSATVDQRQTGDLNVQIDLKNLQLVGLTKGKEEYVDYDYAYDYSEMTIKPPNGITTKKPLNVTEPAMSNKDNTTLLTTVFAEFDQTTSSTANKSSTETVTSTPTIAEPNEPSTATPLPLNPVGTSNSTSIDCKKGFFRNSKGNCELKLQNPSNALLKMIKQKSKLNMSNGSRRP